MKNFVICQVCVKKYVQWICTDFFKDTSIKKLFSIRYGHGETLRNIFLYPNCVGCLILNCIKSEHVIKLLTSLKH